MIFEIVAHFTCANAEMMCVEQTVDTKKNIWTSHIAFILSSKFGLIFVVVVSAAFSECFHFSIRLLHSTENSMHFGCTVFHRPDLVDRVPVAAASYGNNLNSNQTTQANKCIPNTFIFPRAHPHSAGDGVALAALCDMWLCVAWPHPPHRFAIGNYPKPVHTEKAHSSATDIGCSPLLSVCLIWCSRCSLALISNYILMNGRCVLALVLPARCCCRG